MLCYCECTERRRLASDQKGARAHGVQAPVPLDVCRFKLKLVSAAPLPASQSASVSAAGRKENAPVLLIVALHRRPSQLRVRGLSGGMALKVRPGIVIKNGPRGLLCWLWTGFLDDASMVSIDSPL